MEERDIPPPPYSETDIYSNSGTVSFSANPTDPASAPSAPADASSSASTSGEPVYTPPLTPQSTHHGNYNNFLGPVSEHTLGTAVTNSDSIVSPAAQYYFQSRPPSLTLSLNSESTHEHVLDIKPQSQPSDFSYPGNEFATRDVTIQDWLTFRNFLFPAHSTLATKAALDRKLQEEQESEARFSEAEGNHGGTSPSVEQARFQAQEIGLQHTAFRRSRAQQEETIAEWNASFFSIRGILIKLTPIPSNNSNTHSNAMPGTFEPAFDPLSQASVEPLSCSPRLSQSQPSSHSCQRFNLFSSRSGGIRIGNISIDANGVRLGDSFSADSDGLRMGRLMMDSNGVRYGDNNFLQPWASIPGVGGPRRASTGRSGRNLCESRRCSTGPFGIPTPSIPAMPSVPSIPQGPPIRPILEQGHISASGMPLPSTMRENSESYSTRGRSPHIEGIQLRDLSVSSWSSSSSSVSTSSSEDSIGSLPSPSDLGPTQLPVLESRLQEWLSLATAVNSPDDYLTRSNVTQLRDEVRHAGSLNAGPREAAEAGAKREQIKILLTEFKALKKRQQKDRKKARKDRKLKKKAEKKERKRQKKETRQALREARRQNTNRNEAESSQNHVRGNSTSVPLTPTIPMPPNPPSIPTSPVLPNISRSNGWPFNGNLNISRFSPWNAPRISPGNSNSNSNPWGNWNPGNWGEQWAPNRGREGSNLLPWLNHHGSQRHNYSYRHYSHSSSRNHERNNPDTVTRGNNSSSGSGFFNGLSPGAWPGEHHTTPNSGVRLSHEVDRVTDTPAETVHPQLFRETNASDSGNTNRVVHTRSQAKMAAADQHERQLRNRAAQLVMLQESIEGIEWDLENMTMSLVSEMEEYEQNLAAAEMDVEHAKALKMSKVEELQGQLHELTLLPKTSNENTSGRESNGKLKKPSCSSPSSYCMRDKDFVKTSNSKVTLKLDEESIAQAKSRIENEIQALERETLTLKAAAQERRSCADNKKQRAEEKLQDMHSATAEKMAEIRSKIRIVETDMRELECNVERLREEADYEMAKEMQEVENAR